MLSRPTALVVVALLFGANLLFAFPYRDLGRNPDGTAKTATPEDKKHPFVGPPAPVNGCLETRGRAAAAARCHFDPRRAGG